MTGRKSKYSFGNLEVEKNKKWRVAQYIRISQEDDDTGIEKCESNSITSQKVLLNEYIEEHDDLDSYDIYIDDGYTGTDFNRPGFQRLIADMEKEKINCVLVKDLSRLGRNYIEVGNYIEQIFPLFDVRFIAINDNVDSFKNPMSTNTILIPFKNLINDEYARDTSSKIKSALNGRKKKGEFIGAFPSYGYVKDKLDKHKLVIDEESAGIVKKIFEWKVKEGLGNLSICHRLNDMGVLNPTGYKKKKLHQNYSNFKTKKEDYTWCPSTISNILKNDVYIGNVTQGKRKVKSYKIHKIEQVPSNEWITVKNMHEPIIDNELFYKAQELRKVDTRIQKNGILSIWAGILKCADCGRAMHKKYCKNASGTVYEYYICGTYRKKSSKLCTKHTLKVEELNDSVLEIIKLHIELLIDTENMLNRITKTEMNYLADKNSLSIRHNKEEEMEKIKNIKRYLYEDWKNGDITKDEYLEYKQKYENDIEKIKKNIISMDKQNEKQKEIIYEKNKWIENLKKNKNIVELDRDIVAELIDYIEVYEDKRIKIHFKFINELDKIICSDKINQGGGVAAPVGGQIFSEVLPYLEVSQGNKEELEDKEETIVPNIVGLSLEEAEKVMDEVGLILEYEENSNKENSRIKEQNPLEGIKVNKGNKIFVKLGE